MSRRKQANPRPIKVDEQTEVGLNGVIKSCPCSDDDDINAMHLPHDAADDYSHEFPLEDNGDDHLGNTSSDNDEDARPVSPRDQSISPDQDLDDFRDYEPLVIDTQDGQFHQSLPSHLSGPSSSGTSSPSLQAPSTPSSIHSATWGSSNIHRRGVKIMPMADASGEKYACPICKQILENSHDLTVHIRSHNSALAPTLSNTCTICGKILSSQSSLDRHMLVHSGERPFKCHICKMSFTTNGNMHRHSRIHKKDGNTTLHMIGKPGRRSKVAKEKHQSKVGINNNVLPDIRLPEAAFKDLGEDASTVAGDYYKMISQAKFKFQGIHPAFFGQHFSMPYVNNDAMDNIGLKRKHLHENAHPYEPLLKKYHTHVTKSEVPKDEQEQETFLCPYCPKTFLCSNGYDNHMMSHHEMVVDLQDVVDEVPGVHSVADELPSVDEVSSHDDDRHDSSPVGFADISFIDFTAEKFPVIAKSWCEKNVRASASIFHNFKCSVCCKAFPCKSALVLHSQIHNAHDATEVGKCILCDCDFSDQQAYQLHMCKHMADNRMNNTTDCEGIDKEDFLAAFMLMPKSEKSNVEFATNHRILLHDMCQNNDYFPRLGQIYQPDIASMSDRELGDSGLSMLPYKLSVSDHLSSSTDQPAGAVTVSSLSLNALHAEAPASNSDSGCSSVEPVHDKKSPSMLICNYCDMTFTNSRAQKGHIRTHLGLSPYKCNLCNYSSADKSTLIRHLRTHNGERPFQCLTCDFAFTTKANCERHVKKKHGKIDKVAIDESIGYNKYVCENAIPEDSFHSPDTICKYCNMDFKFFRALKHHLRSHSSCRKKPFICTKCNVGFSTKANCVRHLQKQHPEVMQHHIEACISVNEPGLDGFTDIPDSRLEEDLDQTNSHAMSLSPGSATSPEDRSSPRVFAPPAHSTPVIPEKYKPPPSVAMKIKDENGGDTPLDFSVRKYEQVSHHLSQAHLNGGKMVITLGPEELPMDLSVQRSPDASPKFKEAGHMKATQPVFKSERVMQCRYCPQGFSDVSHLNRHVRHKHSVFIKQENMSVNGDVVEPDEGMKVPVVMPSWNPSYTAMPHKRTFHQSHMNPVKPRHSLFRNQFENSPTSNGGGSDSSCDLASVTKMLDATNANNFQAYLQSTEQLESNDVDQPLMEMPVSPRMPKREPEFVDLEALQRQDQSDEEIHSDLGLESDAKEDNSLYQDEEDCQNEADDVLTEDSILDKTADSGVVSSSTPPTVKKKRNSYANSPHKLHCPYCTRSFPWASSLTRHLLTHTGQKPYKCPRCPVTFSTKSNRERHLIRKHGVNMLDPASRQTMDRPYKCHLCVFSSFSTYMNLQKHYSERHPGCPIPDLHAQEISTSKSPNMELMENLSAVDSMSDNGSEADMEDVKQELPDVLDSIGTDDHERVYLDHYTERSQINPERDNYNVDKITECWKCGENFGTRKVLVRHLKEHNIDLPFKCYLCDASYNQRHDCLHHQESHHATDWALLKEKNQVDDIETFSAQQERIVDKACGGEIQALDAVDDTKPEPVTSDYAQRKVYCSLCPKRFWSLQDLRRHMRSHTGERPFECDLCQKRFTLKHSMMRHRRKHNGTGSLSPSDDEASVGGDESGRSNVRNSLYDRLINRNAKSKLAESSLRANHTISRPGEPADINSSDILQNLLGVEDSAIDQMLDSASTAVDILGMS